jgi:hypothetical protein
MEVGFLEFRKNVQLLVVEDDTYSPRYIKIRFLYPIFPAISKHPVARMQIREVRQCRIADGPG